MPQTRLILGGSLSGSSDQNVYLKLENELPTGSFKVRGALYALGLQMQRRNVSEVVASSTGNHGAAVAYAAQLLGVKARIFLPDKSNPVKRANIVRLGAEIVEGGSADLAAAFAMADEYAQVHGAFFLNDATDPDLPAGPGTIACEILESLLGVFGRQDHPHDAAVRGAHAHRAQRGFVVLVRNGDESNCAAQVPSPAAEPGAKVHRSQLLFSTNYSKVTACKLEKKN